jgi:hypothetical protein
MAIPETLVVPLTIMLRAAEEGGQAVPSWLVGGGALLALFLLLIGTVAFGGGRDHS